MPKPSTHLPSTDLAPALERLADALAWPLWLLDEQGRPQHANRAAQRLLAAGQPLQLGAQNSLQPTALPHRAEFAQALRAAAMGQRQALRWPGQPGGYAAALQALAPLASGRTLLLLALDSPPAPRSTLTPDLLAYGQAHGLSPAEQRVLQALSEGHSATHAAQQLGLAVSTVRSHIGALRSKTGHATLSALVQTLARLPPRLWLAADGK